METLDFVLRLVDKISAPAKRATRGLRAIQNELDRIKRNKALPAFTRMADTASAASRRLGRSGKGLIQLSANLSLAASSARMLATASAGVLLAPIKEAATFEQSMSKVRAVTNDFTDAQIRLARQLGEDTKFTADQAAQGMANLAIAGFNAAEQMAALGDVLSLDAAAGMNDLAQTAQIGARVMRGFGLEASEMGRVADVLTTTFTNSNTTLEALGETMKFVAPVAKLAGVSLEETAKLAGILGDAGIDASMAGTSMRLAMLRLAGSSTQANKELKRLGITTQDSAGNLRGVSSILVDVGKKISGLGSAQRLKALNQIFGQRGVTAGGVLVDQLTNSGASVVKLDKAFQNMQGTARSVAETMEDNLLGDVTKVESAFSSLKIEIGDQFRPELRDLAQEVKEIIPPMVKWVKANKDLVKSIGKDLAIFAAIMGVLAAIATAASVTTLMWGGLVLAFGGVMKVLGLLSGVIGSVVAFVGELAFVFGAVTVGWLVALGLVIVGMFIWWDEIEAFMFQVGADMSQFGSDIAQGFVDGWKIIWDDFGIDTSVFTNAITDIKAAWGISSPSRVMMGIGENITKGLEIGLGDQTVGGTAINAPAQLSSAAAGALAGGAAGGARTMTITVGDISVVMPEGTNPSDGEGIGNAIATEIRKIFDDGVTQLAAG